MQVLVGVGIVAIIVIAIELSVIAYFAVVFFRQAFVVAKKVEEKGDDLERAIKDTSDFIHQTIGSSLGKMAKMFGAYFSVKTKSKRKSKK